MRRFLFCLLIYIAGLSQIATAQAVQSFSPNAAPVQLSVSTTSSRVALPTSGPTALVVNTGLSTAYLAFGNSSVAATTSGIILNPGCTAAFNVNGQPYLAAITSASTASLSITTGSGLPTLPVSECTVTAGSASATAPTVTSGTSVQLSTDLHGSVRFLQVAADGSTLDVTQPQTIQGNQIATTTTAQYTVSTSAVQLFAVSSALHHKGICNTSASVPLYYGFISGVTTSTGMYLAPSACRIFEMSVPTSVVYGIAASSITITTEGW